MMKLANDVPVDVKSCYRRRGRSSCDGVMAMEPAMKW
jgi:hypothetical protein